MCMHTCVLLTEAGGFHCKHNLGGTDDFSQLCYWNREAAQGHDNQKEIYHLHITECRKLGL